mgnify:CR=1 FL=1
MTGAIQVMRPFWKVSTEKPKVQAMTSAVVSTSLSGMKTDLNMTPRKMSTTRPIMLIISACMPSMYRCWSTCIADPDNR